MNKKVISITVLSVLLVAIVSVCGYLCLSDKKSTDNSLSNDSLIEYAEDGLTVYKGKPREGAVSMVFLTDSNYVLPTKVAIRSAIKSKDKDSIYDIFVVAVDVDEDKRRELEELSTENARVIVLNQKNIYKDDFFLKRFETHAYNLRLGSIFPGFDKILYLDSDVLVMKDLKELFSINVGDAFLAAVDSSFSIAPNNVSLFNAGVMLFDIDKYRKLDFLNVFANSDPRSLQEFLNSVFIPMEDVLLISPLYNTIVYRVGRARSVQDILDYYDLDLEGVKTKEDFLKQAVILHYSRFKPWGKEKVFYGDLWLSFLTEEEKKSLRNILVDGIDDERQYRK